ncbi:gamma-glutamylcyclotransferase family protein [Lentzea sp. BCCO 10_0798]|uniref:Putative gamma-glutamylcyclotransferase n=1 Tax=Lentzea kristufekii TaxID=3095430 RepID=A0ABU4U1H0_9PSEU|nr:gamma-glutamylcyclotransferase family protein [Lentzea sp. BCCO 10_0798]MDX8053967.1 gamma-glutamylcyclotransferase family protein [Lentzea sp. BCCO 10_0798]
MTVATEGNRLSCRPDVLFAYGSLTFPEVLQVLLGRVPELVTAKASGWRIAALRDRPFPVLVPGDGAAEGVLILGLTHDEWRILDAFEAPSYELRELDLDVGRGWTYIAGAQADAEWGILSLDWTRDSFDLPPYLRRCTEWRQRLTI